MFYVQRGLVELIVWHVWLQRKFQKQTIKFNEVVGDTWVQVT